MEERKVVRSGNSSFIVSLPIDWIQRNKLEKGSNVVINENEVGDLILSNAKRKDQLLDATKTIIIDDMTLEKVGFEILVGYIQHYQNIIIQGKDMNPSLSKIKTMLKDCIGLEIIEQDKKNIIIKNFTTSDTGLSPRTLIRKITLGVQEMFTLLSRFITEGFSQEDSNQLQELVEQNNRLYLLTRKAILQGIEDPTYIRTFQTTYHQLTKDKVIASSLNQMMFSLGALGKAMLFIEHTKEDTSKLKDTLDSIRTDYDSLLTNLRYKNYSSLADLHERCLKNTLKIKSLARGTRDYFIMESSIYLSTLVELTKQITLEIAE